MEQLIYELNGKRYLLVEVLMVDGHEKETSELIERFDCIHQGIKELSRGSIGLFLSTKGYVIYKVLVPEVNVEAFNKFRKGK